MNESEEIEIEKAWVKNLPFGYCERLMNLKKDEIEKAWKAKIGNLGIVKKSTVWKSDSDFSKYPLTQAFQERLFSNQKKKKQLNIQKVVSQIEI